MTTMNAPVMSGGNGNAGDTNGDDENVSDLFRFMGVPAGLSSVIGADVTKTHEVMTGGGGDSADVRHIEGGLIPSSLFDKLVKLASPEADGKDETTNVKVVSGPHGSVVVRRQVAKQVKSARLASTAVEI